MKGILPDVDVIGQCIALVRILNSPTWRTIWEELDPIVATFEDVGLATNAQDVVVWRSCQTWQLVLVTGNRNLHADHSLEATIRAYADRSSLPVITLADEKRILRDRDYAELVAERMLDHLLNIDDYRGVGRLYVP